MLEPTPAAHRRILVLDDDAAVRAMLAEALTTADYEVCSAADAPAAAALVASHEFGVAILDKNLPGGESGLDVLKTLRQRSPLTRGIIFTGYPSQESAIEALRNGAFDYIEKPIDLEIIHAKVGRAFESYRLAVEHQEVFRKYETLFEIVPGIVWFMTEDGVLKRINQEGAAMLGYAPTELLEQTYDRLLPPGEERSGVHWAFKERRTGARGTRRQVVELRTRTGATKLFEINSTGAYDRSPQEPHRRFWGTLGVGWDITEHAMLQEQLQQACKMEAIGRLAGGVAHDFNNILSVILNNAEIIRSDLAADDPHQGDLKEIERAATTAADLTRQLLAFSRKQPAQTQVVDVTAVARGLEGLLRRLVPENIQIDLNYDAEPCQVRADPSQIEQVVINLVANARDAMSEGGRLAVQTSPVVLDAEFAASHLDVSSGSYVMLAVSDTGHGMSPEVREHLFEPFFTTKPPGRGTGLGLATVYGIIRQAGGHISVYSEVNRGTSVKVYLPAAGEAALRRDAPPPPTSSASTGETILVVEDDPMVRRLAQRVLERHGYHVVVAGNGAEALELFATTEFDLLLTDVVMPKMGGTELAAQMRNRWPALGVVYMSGYVGTGIHDHPMLEERAEFVQKPFTAQSLLGAIRRLLQGARPHPHG
ncbi:MAG: response regulator [Deltaproteobacteria bacterium]|nr:response regulator [Deltaproteobacteria bacterium]